MKHTINNKKIIKNVPPAIGFEPRTFTLAVECITTGLQRHVVNVVHATIYIWGIGKKVNH